MPTGIEEVIAAAAEEVESIVMDVASIGSELTKQAKPDYSRKSGAQTPFPAGAAIREGKT